MDEDVVAHNPANKYFPKPRADTSICSLGLLTPMPCHEVHRYLKSFSGGHQAGRPGMEQTHAYLLILHEDGIVQEIELIGSGSKLRMDVSHCARPEDVATKPHQRC